ncbi:Guanine nucleotide-binding proteinalpha-3 subunit [Aphelenchoides fujianensis]|nr:Guanine nucleotide-binding proteinalpha-3 subunit [Aphelenchoides fujianensis]
MGLCQSQEEKELTNKTKQIDRELMQGHLAQQKVVKLLLLGAGECGKSTVLKQMRILHDHGFSDEEMQKQKAVVYNNTVQAMAQILRGMQQLNITFEKPSLESEQRLVLDVVKRGEESEPFSAELTAALRALWADVSVSKVAVSRGNEFQLTESATHFLESIDRIANENYKPTEQDILLSRIKTTGIVEVKFKMKNVDFRERLPGSPNTYDDQVKFIEEKFEGLNANPDKTIYMHQTCATDTNQVQMILDSCIDLIIQANLQGCGLY